MQCYMLRRATENVLGLKSILMINILYVWGEGEGEGEGEEEEKEEEEVVVVVLVV
jgi:hypothetical protein